MNLLLNQYVSRFVDLESLQTPQNNNFFTNLDSDYLQDLPYLHNISEFCLRLLLAKLKVHKICVYSDYDTDAITATATMYWGLIELGFKAEQLQFYAPDRFTEGYGINLEAIKNLGASFDLIISVDCGINSVIEAKHILSTNCDLIITDHHELTGEIPNCIAVCNPRLTSQNPNSELIIQELLAQIKNSYPSYEDQIKNWLEQIKQIKTKKLMSTAVTGVGVAWFCLVWLSYFLEEVNPV